MGKSLARWIKFVLFRKKSSSRKEPTFSESSPVISELVLVSAHNNEIMREVAKGENSSVQEVLVTDVSQDLEKQVVWG
ncbi:hypothetical protein ZEAMMB73_Zm00001d020088 [Zea mays]|uniref:Uncharacterized protein n=1 Tax=Zea mays TaxID=4577 RepID=A0A1D6I224_MAIZE|nr:hypothetical protein ZEAMMB73_Zm00001d020088 [Zea mays]ONM54248.1 hypothetical protein ZEAMMB73_Zm00001d020088 [Zea mays]ONM54249.1 hypothetical protein ZEAMMB73_Zm00001d020088 [Zea mays]ONM54255.1 hypothetical protein ZEAMMB73_Zm00001d020088 [Zea mays]